MHNETHHLQHSILPVSQSYFWEQTQSVFQERHGRQSMMHCKVHYLQLLRRGKFLATGSSSVESVPYQYSLTHQDNKTWVLPLDTTDLTTHPHLSACSDRIHWDLSCHNSWILMFYSQEWKMHPMYFLTKTSIYHYGYLMSTSRCTTHSRCLLNITGEHSSDKSHHWKKKRPWISL